MAISRYYQARPQEYVSQFVPEDLGLMQRALQQRQGQADASRSALSQYEDELLKRQSFGEYDTGVLKQKRKEFEDAVTGLSEKDLSLPQGKREVIDLIKKYKRDEDLNKIQKAYDWHQKALKNMEELDAKGELAPEIVRAYQERAALYAGPDGKGYTGPGLLSNSFSPDAPARPELEKFVDNVKASGYTYDQERGTWKHKLTKKEISKEQLQAIMGSNIETFKDTQAGRQMALRAKYSGKSFDQKFWEEAQGVIGERVYKYTSDTKTDLTARQKRMRDEARENQMALLSVGNHTLADMGNTLSGIDDITNLSSQDATVAGAKLVFEFVSDIGKSIMSDEYVPMEGKSFEDWFTTKAQSLLTQTTPEEVEKLKTVALNFKNSMDTEDLKKWNSYTGKEKQKVFKEYIEDTPTMSVESLGKVPLDPKRRTLLKNLVEFNSGVNVPVTVMEGEPTSEQPTLDEYKKEGYKVVSSYVLDRNPANPGERLAIVMEDEDGNTVRVSTKGAAVLGDQASSILPSESRSYISDYLQRASLNYQEPSFTIPLSEEEYYANPNVGADVINPEYSPTAGEIKTNVSGDGYEISINIGNRNYSRIFPTEKADPGTAQSEYKNTLEQLSAIFNSDLPQAHKIAMAAAHLQKQ